MLLGEDFDIPAFHPKDKGKGPAEDAGASAEEDEEEEDEDDSDKDRTFRKKSISPKKRPKPKFVPRDIPAKAVVITPTSSSRPSPALKREAPGELSVTGMLVPLCNVSS